MNRFPAWKYALVGVVVLAAFFYTLPNFFGESPAVQVASIKSTVTVDAALMARIQDLLAKESVPYTGAVLDPTGIRVRLPDTDTQLKARSEERRVGKECRL